MSKKGPRDEAEFERLLAVVKDPAREMWDRNDALRDACLLATELGKPIPLGYTKDGTIVYPAAG